MTSSGETFTISEENCIKKNCGHLLYNYLKSRDIYEAEFACFHNIWRAKDQLHMYENYKCM